MVRRSHLPIENPHCAGVRATVASPAPKGSLIAARLLELREVEVLVEEASLRPPRPPRRPARRVGGGHAEVAAEHGEGLGVAVGVTHAPGDESGLARPVFWRGDGGVGGEGGE